MSAIAIVAVSALLGGLFLLIVAVIVWQEAGRRRVAAEPAYVISDAIEFAETRVEPDVRQRLGAAGVKRIIEWSTFYLQGLADKAAARRGITVVAGGEQRAVEYIHDQLQRRDIDYSKGDITAVLRQEAAYLVSLGIVGDPVNEDELA